MKKQKAITLLSILCALMVVIMAFTFFSFPVGVNDYNGVLGAVELDYDLAGGTAYTYVLSDDNEEEVEDINSVVKTLEQRLTALGYKNYSIKAIKSTDEDVVDYAIRIETRKTDSLADDISVVMAYGEVKFYGGSMANPTEEILTDIKVVQNAQYLGRIQDSDTYQLTIEFTKEAKEEIVKAIEENTEGYYLEIKIGDQVLLSGTSKLTADYFVGNSLAITSSTEASAKQMVLQITSGGLAYKYQLDDIGGVNVTSPYGANVARNIAIVAFALFAVMAVSLLLAYRAFGVAAMLFMILFMLVELWMLLAVPGVVLSLGGVIGMLLASLLATDGMIIIGKRINAELKTSQKTVKGAMRKAFESALIPTINLHVVAGIIALVLYFMTNGLIKGFAMTFGIGVVVSFIATVLFTRMFNALVFPLVKNSSNANLEKEDE